MVARRDNFHRVYDLTERVAPQLFDGSTPVDDVNVPGDDRPVAQQFIEKAINAMGIAQARWVGDYFRMKPRLKDQDLDALVEQGRVIRVSVEGWDLPAYVHTEHAKFLQPARLDKLKATHTSVLSPFDPVVWDRERALALFDFDYRLECYTPEPQRVHGYFVLPILCCGELIGRLDAKAHRAQGIFEVKALHAQSGLRWTAQQINEVARAIAACAQWHGTPSVRMGRTQPAALGAQLRAALRLLQTGGDPH
jgi:uncharacterized protein YcaQ